MISQKWGVLQKLHVTGPFRRVEGETCCAVTARETSPSSDHTQQLVATAVPTFTRLSAAPRKMPDDELPTVARFRELIIPATVRASASLTSGNSLRMIWAVAEVTV